MTIYSKPDVYVGEKPQLEKPVVAVATGYGCLLGVTEKGPIRQIIRTRSFDAWKRIFGERETRSDMAYEAEQFFKAGGVELLTSRICHYSDVDDDTSYTGGVAYRTLSTAGVAATAAEKTGSVGPFNMNPGFAISLDVDNVGPAAATWDATRATKAGSGLSIVDLTGDTLQLSFDSGAPLGTQTVTFTGSEASAADVAATINAQIEGGFAEVNGSEVDISSDTQGTDSLVTIIGGTGLTEIGHAIGASAAGTGDVANINAVTVQEVESVIENDTTAEVTVNVDGSFTISSPTPGASSELDFQSGTALTVLGLSVEVITGTALGATYNTLKFEAGYLGTVSPGLKGNDLEIKSVQDPKHVSAGAGNDLAAAITASDTSVQVVTLDGIAAKSVIKVTDGSNTEYKEVLATRTVVSGGTVQFFVDIVGSFTNGYLVAATTLQTMEFTVTVYLDNDLVETWTQMSMLDTADNYVETVINDEASGSVHVVATDLDADPPGIGADTPATDSAKVTLASGTDETIGLVDVDWIGSSTGRTGLYAMDTDIEFMPFAYVGNNNAAPVHAALAYAESKVFLEFIGYTTVGITSAQAIAYRKTTLGANSKYGCLYAGGIKVLDPAQSSITAKRSISGVGAVMGVRARVDNLSDPNGGPWQTPAGEGVYGRIYDAQDVATAYDDTEHGNMNVAGINVMRKFGKNSPILIWGGRTLYDNADKKWRYINTLRFFQFVEKSVADNTRWSVFRNNDFRLWSSLKDRIDAFLTDLIPRRAFPTSEKDLAFYIKSGVTDGVMTQTNIDNGEVISEIGLAPQKPGEFIQFWFTQYLSGTTVVEG